MEKKQNKTRELLKSKKNDPQTGKEVSLEQLESLCYMYGRRGRGCTLTSTEDSDDILF